MEMGHRNSPLAWAFLAVIAVVILVNALTIGLETVPDIYAAHAQTLFWIDALAVMVFTVEYAVRIWTAVETHGSRYRHPIKGRRCD